MAKKKSKICPRCDEEYTDYPALSRRDNKTNICSGCGTDEAIIDMQRQNYTQSIILELKFMQLLIRKKSN